MAGEMALERLFLRPKEFYTEKNIELHIGKSALRIDPDQKIVEFNDGNLDYDHLVLATGSRPRDLPPYIGGKVKNLFTMRDLNDANSDGVPDFTNPVEKKSAPKTVEFDGWNWHKGPWVYNYKNNDWNYYSPNVIWSYKHDKWFTWDSSDEAWKASQ